MWILVSVVAAVSSGFRRVYDKKLTVHFGAFSQSLVVNLLLLIPMGLCLFFFPIPADIRHLPLVFWAVLLLNAGFMYPIQISLYLRAVREGEMSSVMPLTTLTPIFNIATSLILLGEIPSKLGFVGIGVIVVAIILLLYKKGARMRFGPELYMTISMIIFAGCASLDKFAMKASTPIFYIFTNVLTATIFLFFFTWGTGQLKEIKKAPSMHGQFLVTAGLLAVSFLGLEFALSLGPTSYVLAIRTGSFVIATLWGIWKLKETASPRKIVAILAFIAGSVLLAFA